MNTLSHQFLDQSMSGFKSRSKTRQQYEVSCSSAGHPPGNTSAESPKATSDQISGVSVKVISRFSVKNSLKSVNLMWFGNIPTFLPELGPSFQF